MSRTGRTNAIESLCVVLGTLVVFAGCTSPRPFTATDSSGAPVQTVQQVSAVRTAQSGDGAMPEADAVVPALWGGSVGHRPAGLPLPRELEKASHPTYVIEPPDILLVDAARLIPLPPYKVEPLDALSILVTNTLPKAPIEGIYSVDTSGNVDLGFTYGSVALHGQTLKEAKKSIEEHLKAKLNPPFEVYVSLAETKAMQQVRGEHLVRQDGTIGLGTYGAVYVTGMTIAQAKAAIEKHLSQFLFEPRVSVDVAGFNSHVYFVIFDFPGASGQQIFRRPITGNETVLDALSDYNPRGGGLPPGVSKKRIWVARPTPAEAGHTEILPVDWNAITRNGNTATNYQLLPGDRIFVGQDPLTATEVALSRIFAPAERIFGITLFGSSVVQQLRNPNGFGSNGTR